MLPPWASLLVEKCLTQAFDCLSPPLRRKASPLYSSASSAPAKKYSQAPCERSVKENACLAPPLRGSWQGSFGAMPPDAEAPQQNWVSARFRRPLGKSQLPVYILLHKGPPAFLTTLPTSSLPFLPPRPPDLCPSWQPYPPRAPM